MATTKKSTTKPKTKKATASKKPAAKKVSSAAASKKTTLKKTTTAAKSSAKNSVKKPLSAMAELNIWNWAMAGLHAAQAVAIVLLSQNKLFSVSTNYLTVDTIADKGTAPTLVPATRHLFDINLAYLMAAFFVISAAAHLYIATLYRKKYEADLKSGINKVRWFEYGLSASVMMVAIAMLVGVSDLSTLILIFGATSVMNLCGLMMEVHNQTTQKTNWLSFMIGTKSGFLSWIVVGLYLWGSNQYGEGTIPTFVYYIFGSMFVLFASFAANMYLQYRKKGQWANYFYGERAYMILSLVAKSTLAWQVFVGTLRP